MNFSLLLKLTPIGTIVYQSIVAMDRDMPNRPNSQISFSIAPGPFSGYFELPLTTKSDIAIARLVHYDTFSSCNLTIIAHVRTTILICFLVLARSYSNFKMFTGSRHTTTQLVGYDSRGHNRHRRQGSRVHQELLSGVCGAKSTGRLVRERHARSNTSVRSGHWHKHALEVLVQFESR